MELKYLKVSSTAVAGLCLWLASPAHAVNPAPATWPAGDAVRGKTIYNNNCSGCHLGGGSTLSGVQRINQGAGAGGAGRINNALLTSPAMQFLEPTLSAQHIADLNAYLTNPALNGIAATSASATPSNLNFPQTEVGSSSTVTVTFTAAVGPVTLSSLAISPSIYTITGGTCAANLVVPAGGTCTTQVTFAPTASGTNATGNLTFNHNASASTSTTVSLMGTGSAVPVAQVAPATLAFAATAVGASSPAQVVTLSNSGNAPLNLSALAVTSPAFRISGGTCATGSTLPAAGQCTVHVSLSPTAAGAANASLTLRHNGGSGGMELTSSVPLSGMAVANAPAVVLSPSTLALAQMVGTASPVQTVTLSNQGTAPVTLSGVSTQGAQAGEFARSGGTCATTLAAGASCTLGVAFTPAAAGTRTATLSVAHSAAGTPSTVALNGQGTAAAMAALSLNTQGLSFTPQALSSTSAAQTLTVTNSGPSALTLSALTLAGTNAGDFLLGAGSCAVNTPVAAGASCTVLVSSRPGSVGAKTAHLSLASNAANGAVTVPLLGRGVSTAAAVAVFAPNSVEFGNATVGAPAVTRVVRLTNTGGGALSVAGLNVAGAGVSQTNNCGASVAAGASCNVTLSYSPTSAIALNGSLTLTSNAAGSPLALALTGTGTTAASPVLGWAVIPDGAFADTAVGSVAMVKTFTLNNAGPGAAMLGSVQASGAQQGEFVLGGTCLSTTTLAAAGSCTVTVGFAPALMGARTAQLQLQAVSGAAPAPVALTGRGVALARNAVTPSAASLAFPSTAMGATAVLPVSFSNTGSTAMALNSLTFGNAMFTAQLSKQPQCVALPLMLEPGQTCAVDVSFRPTSTAAQADALSLGTNLSAATRVELSSAAGTGGTDNPNGGTPPSSGSGGGGGGCSLVASTEDAPLDPTLWLLCLAALGVLWHRARKAA